MRLSACTLAGALIVTSNALADDAPVTTVIVAGARYDQRRDDTASTIVVNRDELLRQGDRTLADALKRQPGITISDNAGRSRIRMRGLGDGYTRILLNGVPVPDEFSLESIAPELIERIDIVPTASAELGTQAIAGTINVILRKAAPRARQPVKLGSDEQRGKHAPSISAERAGGGDGYSYTVAATLQRTVLVNTPDERETAAGLERRTQSRETDIRRSFTLSPRIDWKLGDGDTLSLQTFASTAARMVDADAHEQTLAGAPSSYPDRSALLGLHSAFLRGELAWARSLGDGARIEWKAGVDRSRRYSDFDFAAMPNGVRGSGLHLVHSDIDEDGVHAGGKYVRTLGASHRFVAGWDAARDTRAQTRVERQRGADGVLLPASDDRYAGVIERAAVYLQDDWDIDSRWSLSAGLRWETLVTSVASTASATVRQGSQVLSPILQTLYKLAPGQQLRVGLSRSYKAPTMFALIPRRYTVDNNNSSTNPHTQGNPALRPEVAWGLDVGYDLYFGKDGMVSASAFLRRIDQVTAPLLFQDRGEWVSMQANQGAALARGVAFEAKLPLGPASALRANLARNWSHIDRIPGPGNRLDGQTPFSANLGIDYRPRDAALSLGASFNVQGGGLTRSSAQVASYRAAERNLELYGAWSLSPRTRLRINALNLLRRDTVTARSYSGQGEYRSTSSATPTFAALRITLEHEFGK